MDAARGKVFFRTKQGKKQMRPEHTTRWKGKRVELCSLYRKALSSFTCLNPHQGIFTALHPSKLPVTLDDSENKNAPALLPEFKFHEAPVEVN